MKLHAALAAGLLAASLSALAGEQPHWAYEGHGGAEEWGELDPAFKLCKDGKQQSPIDIRHAPVSAAVKPIGFSYKASAAELVNNGHTIQANLADAGSITLADGEYKLLQFHFHTPSEEMIDGKAYPLVAHLVHKSADGKLAVVAVLFTLGKENAALREVFAKLPKTAGATAKLDAAINPTDLLPADRAYYRFMGSLTTPPCSEGVRWQVLKQPVELSSAQFASFRALYSLNARPVQPLHGRKVQSSK